MSTKTINSPVHSARIFLGSSDPVADAYLNLPTPPVALGLIHAESHVGPGLTWRLHQNLHVESASRSWTELVESANSVQFQLSTDCLLVVVTNEWY